MPEIGATLREARMRARIDVSEIEAQTKIRAKYLRALENEEWDLLPGPTFVKSFLRTYGNALGLDGRSLVEEYKLHYEHPGDGLEPIQQAPVSSPRHARQRMSGAMHRGAAASSAPRSGPSRAYLAAVGAIGVVIVLLLYALLSGGSSPSPNKTPSAPTQAVSGFHGKQHHAAHTGGAASATVTPASVRFEPSAEVYVCLIGDGRKRVPGVILAPGAPEPTYHARRFELTLGNNDLTLIVNGRALPVPASSNAIGYAITHTGVRELPSSEQPTCK
jgi:cytoskeleton protein RodZ